MRARAGRSVGAGGGGAEMSNLQALLGHPQKWLTLGVAQSPTAARGATKAIAGRSERVSKGVQRGRSGRRGNSRWS